MPRDTEERQRMLGADAGVYDNDPKTTLKKELLRIKDIVDGMTDKAHTRAIIDMTDVNDSAALLRLSEDATDGINAILELAEELERK